MILIYKPYIGAREGAGRSVSTVVSMPNGMVMNRRKI